MSLQNRPWPDILDLFFSSIILDGLRRSKGSRTVVTLRTWLMAALTASLRAMGLVGTCMCLVLPTWADAPVPPRNPSPPELKPGPAFRIHVADTSTRVLLAEVHLEVSDLVLSEADGASYLVGTYSIEVPLRRSKDESGAMKLPLNKPIAHYLKEGGVLEGKGQSFKVPDAKREIVCRIEPAAGRSLKGRITLEIDTGKRVLEFESTFSVSGNPPGTQQVASIKEPAQTSSAIEAKSGS